MHCRGSTAHTHRRRWQAGSGGQHSRTLRLALHCMYRAGPYRGPSRPRTCLPVSLRLAVGRCMGKVSHPAAASQAPRQSTRSRGSSAGAGRRPPLPLHCATVASPIHVGGMRHGNDVLLGTSCRCRSAHGRARRRRRTVATAKAGLSESALNRKRTGASATGGERGVLLLGARPDGLVGSSTQ